MLSRNDVKVIGGCNLPMITNACFERDDVSLEELSEIVLEIGRSTMNDMHLVIQEQEANTSDEFKDAL